MLRAISALVVLMLSFPTNVAAQRGEVTENAVRAEAWLFIPEDWRGRVRPLASAPLPEGCSILPGFGLWGSISATPSAAAPRAFLLKCAPARPAFEAIRAGDLPTIRWMSAESLETLATMRLENWSGDVATVDGAARVLVRHSPALVDLEGRSRPIAGADDLSLNVTESGRYALVDGGVEVIDIESGAVAFRRPLPTDQRPIAFSVLQESEAGELEMVGIRRDRDICVAPYAPCASELVVLDLRTRRERVVGIVASGDASVLRYGSRQVRFYTEPEASNNDGTFDIVIVDLDDMQITWRGRPSQAPPPRIGRQCLSMAGVRYSARGTPGPELHLRVGLDGAGFSVPGAVACAMTGDGDRLALVTPGLIHLYSVD